MIVLRGLGLISIGVLVVATAVAAEPIKYFTFPDGRIRLWLKSAPTVTATNSAGWQIEPAGKEKDRTWLDRLKSFGTSNGASPWKSLLDAISSGTPPNGTFALAPKATITISGAEGSPSKLSISAADGKSMNDDLASGSGASVLHFLATATGADDGVVKSALLHYPNVKADPTNSVGAFASAASHAPAPLIFDTGNGPAVIAVSLDKTAAALPPSTPSDSPKPDDKPKAESQLPLIPIATGLGGLLVGLLAGYAMRRPEPPENKPSSPARPQAPNPSQQEAAWARERENTFKALDEERGRSQRFKAEADAANAKLKQAQDEAVRVRQELGHQLEAMQRSSQSSQVVSRAITAKGEAYGGLVKSASEAMGFLQAEIGRPEVSAAVGYLLTYSCAALLETVSKPNPNYERAMLDNIERLAGAFPSSPYARKLANDAKVLCAGIGSGPIVESSHAHAHARQFDEILRYLRVQRNLELSPFYFGVDAAGAAHAIYV